MTEPTILAIVTGTVTVLLALISAWRPRVAVNTTPETSASAPSTS
jgi:hypothetical protein